MARRFSKAVKFITLVATLLLFAFSAGQAFASRVLILMDDTQARMDQSPS